MALPSLRTAYTSLRARVSGVAGAAKEKLLDQYKEVKLEGATSRQKLQSAIKQKVPVEFYYSNKLVPFGGTRRVVPRHIFTRRGTTYLMAYAIRPGASASRPPTGWRQYILSRVVGVRLPPLPPATLRTIGRAPLRR